MWTNLFDESEHLQVKGLAAMQVLTSPPPSLHPAARLISGQLDTFLYCGHTSGADILWAGVPTVTLPGIMQVLPVSQ